ncbi:unnamed protein product [Dovyalis caffra]|uniref:Uncharacterized protein n=1 Tax=Dovyalis caffra TaxID=77055 RepID=A0AAV1SHB8_9ROSI|nr:unnamed protein product [Dovyalis caffra]
MGIGTSLYLHFLLLDPLPKVQKILRWKMHGESLEVLHIISDMDEARACGLGTGEVLWLSPSEFVLHIGTMMRPGSSAEKSLARELDLE